MQFVPYRLLRDQPNELRRRLEEQGELVVTVNGEPLALMLSIPKGNPEDFVFLISRVRAQLAVAEIREGASKSERNRMSSEDIDALIKQTRDDRRANQHS